jgi:molecular chaperone DnaK
MSKIIGIDLGTTNSVVCVMEGNEPKVITNEEGGRTTPSVVGFEANGNVLVGLQARRQSITNPENTIGSAKRFIGRNFEDISEDVKRVPFKVARRKDDGIAFDIRGKLRTPPEISSHVLMKLKKAAEDYLGEPVTEAVITVPAYFNDAQRQATKDAGQIAGLDVKRIVNEPTAAALAYGRAKGTQKEQIVAVYDLGGGTFDISILEIDDNVVEVISTNGDTHLGGDDFDDRIMDWMIQEFKKETGLDISKDNLVRQRVKQAAEAAKIELSHATEADINLPFLTADNTGPKHLQVKLSRSRFESMVEDLVERSIEPLKKALADAKKTIEQIDEVLLVGGSTRIPAVQKAVEKFFGKPPNKSVNPDEVVGLGAAVQAGVLSGDVTDIVLVDVTPLSLGIETQGGVMTVLIPRNSTIPSRKSETFTTAADSQPSVEIHVLQGERKMASGNRTLGKFNLTGLPMAPRGVPQIEVTFDIDANGIVSVSALDKATNKQQRIIVTAGSGMSDAEIEQLVEDARAHEEEDERRREAVENRNKLDSMIIQVEKFIAENDASLPPGARLDVESALKKAKESLEEEDDARVVREQESLTKASHRLSQMMYDSANSNQRSDDSGPADVIDADFEEKN